jgi:hypothetical protein
VNQGSSYESGSQRSWSETAGSNASWSTAGTRKKKKTQGLPFIPIHDPDEIKFARKGDFETKEKGSLVRFGYFKAAVARSTSVSLEFLFEAAEKGDQLDMEVVAIKGRPFQFWDPRDGSESESTPEAERFGYGKICLASEKGREFWLTCVGREYTDESGDTRITGVSNPADCERAAGIEDQADQRVLYYVGLPNLIWDGLSPKIVDVAEMNKTRCERLLKYLDIMSKSSLKPEGCEAGVTDSTAGRIPWTRVAIRASVAWDRAAQALEHKIEGPLGELTLERRNPRKLGQAHGGSRGVGGDLGDDVLVDEVFEGTMDHSGSAAGGMELSPQTGSPDGSRGKVDVLVDQVKYWLSSLTRSLAGTRDPKATVGEFKDKLKNLESYMETLTIASFSPAASAEQRQAVQEILIRVSESKDKTRHRIHNMEIVKRKPSGGKQALKEAQLVLTQVGGTPKRKNSKPANTIQPMKQSKGAVAASPPKADPST